MAYSLAYQQSGAVARHIGECYAAGGLIGLRREQNPAWFVAMRSGLPLRAARGSPPPDGQACLHAIIGFPIKPLKLIFLSL
jgi:hypothetical protein